MSLEDHEQVRLVADLSVGRLSSWLVSMVGKYPAKEPFLVQSWAQGLGHGVHLYGTSQLHCFYKCEKEMFDFFMNEIQWIF